MPILTGVRFPGQAASKQNQETRQLRDTLTIRIDWSDLDLFGHVNNVMFFKYMQASRLAFCEKIGLTSVNEKGKLSFMVASSKCDFRKSLYYPGSVAVSTSVAWARNTSFCLTHVITDDKGEVCGEGEDVLVLFNYGTGQKVEIPDQMRLLLGT